MAGTALSIHGVIAVANAVFQQRLDPKVVLTPLTQPVHVNGEAVDYFSYKNPVWEKSGALVAAEDKDGNERLTLRMSFQTRKAVADELKSRTGIVSA